MKAKKFFIYARKSSESEERQIQSLDDQLKIMRNKAKSMWVTIVDEFVESMSAKAPWRYKFNEMIQRLQKWEAEWILSWKLDRISRNPVDTWTIQYMLQKRDIDVIITNDREYYPEDSWLIMSVETWMANQYILDLIKNVRRWLDSKYEKGIRPTKAPLWYINDRNNGGLAIDDPERAHIIRKMFDLMLTGDYLPPKILDIANDKWWLRTRVKKNTWWNSLSRAMLYKIFKSVFYAGYFYHNWEFKKGIHKPMISLEEYDRIQVLLWKKWNPRPQNYEFSFTWMIRCWGCWNMITAEIKNRFIKELWGSKKYTYYHCTKRSIKSKCEQKSLRIEELENQILEILSKIEIKPRFKNWAINQLKNNLWDEMETRLKILDNINRTLSWEERKLNNLTEFLLDEIITKDEFDLKKNSIKLKIERLKGERDNIDLSWGKSMETTIKVFEFALTAKEKFINWSLQEKKEIFSTLGQNFLLKDWKLALELRPWFQTLEKELMDSKDSFNRFETIKNSTNLSKVSAISSNFQQWSSIWEEVRKALYDYDDLVYIPDLNRNVKDINTFRTKKK